MLIIQTAIQSLSKANTVVVGEDTGLLLHIIPCKHGQQRVVLQTRAEAKKKLRLWNIKASKEKLGSCINFALSWHRQDTKSSAMMNVYARKCHDIISAGEKALVLLYKRFQEKVVKSLTPKIYHQLQHQPSSIASGYTTRFKSGGEKLDI